MKPLKVAIPLLVVALVAGWYWFRPERLVTNRAVNEAFPAINDSQTQILESGTFHSCTHPTERKGNDLSHREWQPSSSVHELQDISRP